MADPVDHPANALLGIVHNVAHVGAHHLQAEALDDAAQFLHALLVGCDLRLDVGHVNVGAARRVGRRGQ